MRRNAITSAVQEESDEINLTPMLDVVFIMLIFFIVTANFIKEPGLEINRPDSDTAETQENAAILIAVGPTGEVWMDGRRIDVRQVKANVVKLLADNPQGSVVIQADEKAMADTIIQVMDGARVVMPERQIDTFMTEVDKPEKPEEQPEDIAQPELDLQPLTGIDVSIAKPKANFKSSGSFFRDGEYIPLFKVQPIYPRRAQERGTQGFAIVSFTITESGSVENAKAIEGYCGDPTGPESELRPCTMFNSASARAALKLKYKPKIVDGKATSVSDVLHRFTFIMADEEGR